VNIFTELRRRYENGETRNMADFSFSPFQLSIYVYLGFCPWFEQQQTEAFPSYVFIEMILNPRCFTEGCVYNCMPRLLENMLTA
jgi:hypothetical protein